MRVLIADDEVHIIDELKYIISSYDPEISIDSCVSGTEALNMIRQKEPDMAFLDIEMPKLNGLELGNILKEMKKSIYIVYVTAYDQFAVEAYKTGARGYVLKPFADDEIKEQLTQAEQYIMERNILQGGEAAPGKRREYKSHIAGCLNERTYIIDVNDVNLAYASNRKVFIKTRDATYDFSKSLYALESMLNPNMFMRCHRNFIVNISKVSEIVSWFNSTYKLILNDQDKTEVPISRNYIEAFRKKLGMR